MNKASKTILHKSWSEAFEHPVVRAEHKKRSKLVTPSKDEDFVYTVGVQHGWLAAFEFFMDTLPKRVAREVKEDERRQQTSLSSEITTGLPVT